MNFFLGSFDCILATIGVTINNRSFHSATQRGVYLITLLIIVIAKDRNRSGWCGLYLSCLLNTCIHIIFIKSPDDFHYLCPAHIFFLSVSRHNHLGSFCIFSRWSLSAMELTASLFSLSASSVSWFSCNSITWCAPMATGLIAALRELFCCIRLMLHDLFSSWQRLGHESHPFLSY